MVSQVGESATGNSLVTSDPWFAQPTIQQLIDQRIAEFKEALITHVTTRFQHQGRLLEEAERDLAETRRDLDVYKKAFSIAERDKRDLEERFERERQTLSDEIRQLKERDAHGGGFEQEKQALNDGIHQLKAIVTRVKRAVYQQNPPLVSADTRRHARVRDGTKAA